MSAEPVRVSLGKAMERTGWTQIALASHLRASGMACHDTLPAKWLSGERPIPSRAVELLPTDLRVMLARVRAEAEGLHVVDSAAVEMARLIAAEMRRL